MKKLIFLFAFSIAVTNIFAQTDPNQIKKEGNDAFNAKNYPVAYAKFSEYLKQTNNQDSATAYYCGIAADEVKKYAEAVTFFDIAIQKKFNTGNAYARKALALDALKKTDEYVATLEEGLKVDPNNKTMIKNYGLHYLKAGLAAQKAGKAEEAEECFKKVIPLDHKSYKTNYTNGNITDYQAAALIMAIYINGMNYEETTSFTLAMAHSGEVLDLSELGMVVDKHSTGGIGDKITLILMPIIASLGIPSAKMSGRGLGFTGGTVDKLESIPGYNTNIDISEFINNVKNIGISLMGQTLNLAPADKKIYALRDTISCVESIPLIASSIMSKKIAAGAEKIVLEVTVGSGAFMKNIEDATKLSETMIGIGNLADKETICILTNMNQPIGYSIGNSLEVIEAVEALNGNMQDDVKDIILSLGSYMMKLAGKGDDIEQNKKMIMENINNKKALNKFKELIKNQGGDVSYIEDTSKFERAKYIIPIKSEKMGYIKSMDNEKIGYISSSLGAGRLKKEDKINDKVGIIINKKIGDKVNVGDLLGFIHSDDIEMGNNAVKEMQNCYEFSDEYVEKQKHILGIIK